MGDRTARIREASIFSELLILAVRSPPSMPEYCSGTPEFLAFP